ncbi:MAG: DUF2029 domain-containing protein [Bdellovibrionales bacterium]|nr:DUF2029 domain-containing protein [Bdellovibrionales bacterium]
MRARLTYALRGLVFVVLAWAVYAGFSRGGQDFAVFHYAGKLALEGRWDALYAEGPDRFLYAPGFAFLVSPLAALPVKVALGIWLAFTLAAFGAAIRMLARAHGEIPVYLAILFSVRPLLIDLRYGQVNLLILSSAVWALLAWSERTGTRRAKMNLAASWFVFAIAACAKVYPLALFLFPIGGIIRDGAAGRAHGRPAILGALGGAAFLLLPPLVHGGVYAAWFDALARKGLPTDTHNQSLLAFLVRVAGGEPFNALGLSGETLRFPGFGLSFPIMRGIWGIFTIGVLAALARLALRISGSFEDARLSAWLGLALCFLPAHLIWKSYFVLGIPLLAGIFAEAKDDEKFRRLLLPVAAVLGLALACASGDGVGPRASAWIEACAPFFWIHLAAVVTGFSRLSCRASTPRSA